MFSAVQAVLTGAESVKATFKVQVGWRQTEAGKETAVYISVRVPGPLANVKEAIAALANLPKVKVSIPATFEGLAQLRQSPVMTGERASVVFAHYGQVAMPSIADDKIASHLKACGIEVKKEVKPEPRTRKGRKAEEVPAEVATVS